MGMRAIPQHKPVNRPFIPRQVAGKGVGTGCVPVLMETYPGDTGKSVSWGLTGDVLVECPLGRSCHRCDLGCR